MSGKSKKFRKRFTTVFKDYLHNLYPYPKDISYQNDEWTLFSKHPEVTWEFIVENYDLPWDWSAVSENPNITLEIVKSTTPSPECPRPMLSPCWNKEIIEKRFYNSENKVKN